MPDLQTALTTAIKNQVLSTTIKEWDEEEKQEMQTATQTQAPSMQTTTPEPTLTGNLSKDIFTYIKDNPGCLTKDVRKVFITLGFKESSVGSLVTQMVRNKLVTRNDVGNLEAIRVRYKPLVTGVKKKLLYKKLGVARTQPQSPRRKASPRWLPSLPQALTRARKRSIGCLPSLCVKRVLCTMRCACCATWMWGMHAICTPSCTNCSEAKWKQLLLFFCWVRCA
jgi:hypothetical protein